MFWVPYIAYNFVTSVAGFIGSIFWCINSPFARGAACFFWLFGLCVFYMLVDHVKDYG